MALHHSLSALKGVRAIATMLCILSPFALSDPQKPGIKWNVHQLRIRFWVSELSIVREHVWALHFPIWYVLWIKNDAPCDCCSFSTSFWWVDMFAVSAFDMNGTILWVSGIWVRDGFVCEPWPEFVKLLAVGMLGLGELGWRSLNQELFVIVLQTNTGCKELSRLLRAHVSMQASWVTYPFFKKYGKFTNKFLKSYL